MIDFVLSWRSITWLDYFFLYISPGIVIATYLLINAWRERSSEFARVLMKLIGKEISLAEQLKEAGVYCLALICVLFGWPGFVIWFFKRKKDEATNQAWQALPDFECTPEYLITEVSPVDAEIASYIIDPLGSVPPLPFGHLNECWANFLSEMMDDQDEMWSFYIPKGSKTGKYQFKCSSDIRGYAKVRDGKVLAEFITERD